jgi:hypothetical protein
MVRRREVFDATRRVLLENPNVTAVTLLYRPNERGVWETEALVVAIMDEPFATSNPSEPSVPRFLFHVSR